jgi:aminopeptidase YwaD
MTHLSNLDELPKTALSAQAVRIAKKDRAKVCSPPMLLSNTVESGLACLVVMFGVTLAIAQQPFLPSEQWVRLRDEASGAAPYENLRYLTRLHRVPATAEFDQAAQFVLERAREYGLVEVQSEQFPIDGKTPYGLMRSYLGWRVETGRLWEVQPQHLLLGDWTTDPIRLADYSHDADVETALVDVGDGSHEADYGGKDVHGKIVLADGVLARVQQLAVTKYGAAGIVSDMPNQTTAWSGLDRTLVRWGHAGAGGICFHGFTRYRRVTAGAPASR